MFLEDRDPEELSYTDEKSHFKLKARVGTGPRTVESLPLLRVTGADYIVNDDDAATLAVRDNSAVCWRNG